MSEKLGWGVVGMGRRAQEIFIPALLASPSSRLVGVLGRDPAKVKQESGQWPELAVFHNLDGLLADPAIEAVYISSPHFLHVPHAVQCMEAGKHVFMESPLALSVDGAHKLSEKAKARGVKLGVAFQFRFHPALLEAARAVAAGELGQLRFIEVSLAEPFNPPPGSWWRDAGKSGPAALIRLGVLGLDLLSWFKRGDFEEVAAMGTDDPETSQNTICSMLVRFKDGSPAYAMAASSFHDTAHCLRLEGSEGKIEVRGDFNGAEVTTLTRTAGEKAETREFEPDDAVGAMIDAFVSSVRGGPEFLPAGPEGKRIVEVTCAAIESMKSRRSVKVGEILRLT